MSALTTALTTAERRALQRISTGAGKLAVLAADQRGIVARMLSEAGKPSGVEDVRAVKLDLCETLGREASAVLLDPEIGLPEAVDAGAVPRSAGLLVTLEQEVDSYPEGLRETALVAGVGAAGVRRLGGDAAKLHVWVRPDREDLDGPTATLVRAVLEECRQADLLCVVEGLLYPLPGESDQDLAARKHELVPEEAAFLAACGAPLLKLEYPGSADACRAVTEASSVPWALLSAGVDHERFVVQLRYALDGGAIGFIAGRSLWKDAVGLPQPERRSFLLDRGLRRLGELLELLAAA